MSKDVYERLAQRLDDLPNGFPRTESGVELSILRKIFTEDEAEITCNLKLLPETPQQIAERLGREQATFGDTLEKMVERGEIGAVGPLGDRKYHMMPFIVGVYEFQLNRMDRELVELMEEYINQGLFEEIGASTPSFMHTIPVERAIDVQLKVHPF